MNFLAHFFLSCGEEGLLVGNFLADFIKNRDTTDLPLPVVEGIQLHRKIDSFTDGHPVVRRSARRLYSRHGKYAPVLLDIYYDYFLAANWSRYSEETLPEFTGNVYRILLKHIDLLPAFLQERTRRMVEDDWLMSYTHYEGLFQTFRRMRRRVSKPEQLDGATDTLKAYEAELEADFRAFFPDLVDFVKTECRC